MNRIALLISLLIVIPCTALAQFNPRNNAAQQMQKIDTMAIKQKIETPKNLNIQVYNDAYDDYLKMMRRKQRNVLEFSSLLNITQTSFSNWAAGGNNSFSGRGAINASHTYSAPIFNVKSIFDAAYGFITSDGNVRKNEDYFNITSTPSWKIANHFELSASLMFKSQFTNSYKAPADTLLISSFMAPATLTPSLGVTYFNKSKSLTVFLAPLSGNITLVLNDTLSQQGSFGVKPGQKINSQLGSMVRVNYKDSFYKDKLGYETKFELFIRFEGTPILWWENKLSFKFTNLLSANFYLLTIYNDQIPTPQSKEGKNNFWQFNESLGFGISYRIKSKKYEAPPENNLTKAREKTKRKNYGRS